MSRATVIAITSDQHCGSTIALCPPKVHMDDGGEYVASAAQRWLWGNWQAFWKRAAAVRKEHNARFVQVYNGDMTDGDHHGTSQILSGNPTVQAAVVNAALHIPKSLSPDEMFFIRGTEAHVGKSASFEERIALGLKKDGMPVIPEAVNGNASHWHAKMEYDGVRLDFAHHGRMGQRPWTKGSIANYLAFQIWTEHHLRDEPHPHVAVRSHMHQFWDTADAYPTRLIQTASFQLATAYVHKVVTESSLADVGGVILVIKRGKLTVEPVLFRPASPQVWRPAT